MSRQSKLTDYVNIIKYHGLFKGLRRAKDQFFENDLYDITNKTNFSEILGGDQFYGSIDGTNSSSVMHYQPAYTSAVTSPLKHLAKSEPSIGASSACYIDLGAGRGKTMHIAKKCIQHLTTIGVDLNGSLLDDAAKNLGFSEPTDFCNKDTDIEDSAIKSRLIKKDVNHVDYTDILEPYDTVIVFNKNSFDKKTTENTLDLIKKACSEKHLFYVYSNPVFQESFGDAQRIFHMNGWHKNWNTDVFKIN